MLAKFAHCPAIQRSCQLCDRCTCYLRIGDVDDTPALRDLRPAPRRVKLTSVSARWTELQTSVRIHFYIVRGRHMLNAEHSRSTTNFSIVTDTLGRSSRHSADEVELLWLLQTPTFESTTDWRRSSGIDVALLYNYRQLRPDADSEAQSTRRRRHSVADLPAPTTCRRLPHINGLLSPCRDPPLRPLPRRHCPLFLALPLRTISM